ncbi:uncharacterized protein LOC132639621 [Lycium barbarum]|uniref:uncharacterized protein LOC132639621 n=1 Tax=Lycium barbarum TaxID=112863 RepID=UPI00293EBBFF|nr:uncharacterized protein LOC132639621 [Lycium barbarum]
MSYWSPDSLNRVASAIGTPLFADECTTKKTRISFARILIEVNVTKTLPTKIIVKDPNGNEIVQVVDYDWKPQYCEQCLQIGHVCPQQAVLEPQQQAGPLRRRRRRRPRKVIQEWHSKGVITAPTPQVDNRQLAGGIDQPLQEDPQPMMSLGDDHNPNSKQLDKGKANQPSPTLNDTEFLALSSVQPKSRLGALQRGESTSSSTIRDRVVGLLETRVKEPKAQRIMQNLLPGYMSLHNYQIAANGRIWLFWDRKLYAVNLIKTGAQLIHCLLTNRQDGAEWLLTIVYAYNTIEQRKELWETLKEISQTCNKPWLVCGDFNNVLYTQDRIYGNPVTDAEIRDFTDCIQDVGITELPWKGNYYTWTNNQQGIDRIYSRIDRAFGNDDWMHQWGRITTEYDVPNVSDHCPMILNVKAHQLNVKSPFRFFNVWADHRDFSGIVEKVWRHKLDQWTMKNIWLKLKSLRPKLKRLNHEEFRRVTQNIEQARIDLRHAQTQLARQYSDPLFAIEKEAQLRLEKWSTIEESILKQKARDTWIKLGDSNTKYFSVVITEKQHRKQITTLTSLTGLQLVDNDDIKTEIVQFYQGLMGTAAASLPAVNKLIMRNGPVLTPAQQQSLCADVTEVEIWEGLKDIGDEKAPGVDGYNALFFKRTWHIIKNDIISAVKEFFITGRLYKAINCTVVTLVPKTAHPSTVKKFRPIACCTILYKIIAKVLAARMQKVMADIIDEAQTGFIPGRKIADNIIIAHELVKAYTRKNISARCMIKIDLKKAYDSVEWIYLRQVLEELRFPEKFIKWLLECVQTVNYSIIVNGLQANLEKSSVYFGGVNQTVQDNILQHLGYTHGELPFRYLGIPLSSKKLSLLQWQPLIEKMGGRISTWTARKLSYAGRKLCLVWGKYYHQRALVAWDKVCTPKSAGGLNLINLKIWNRAAIAKNSWDVAHKEDKLWIRWIHTYYIKEQNFDTMPIPQQACWMVRKLLEARSVWIQHPINHTSTKQSLIRHIYLQLLGNLPRTPWKTMMFKNMARPKAILTMWLMLQKRLPTVDRLIDWGINADPVCSLCSSTQETRDHLFADCALTKQMWNKLLKWMNRPRCTAQSWDQMLHWVIVNSRGKSSAALLFRLIYAEACHAI